MSAGAEVNKHPDTPYDVLKLQARKRDVASCQHEVDAINNAIAQQTEALKIAEGHLAESQERLEAFLNEGPKGHEEGGEEGKTE